MAAQLLVETTPTQTGPLNLTVLTEPPGQAWNNFRGISGGNWAATRVGVDKKTKRDAPVYELTPTWFSDSNVPENVGGNNNMTAIQYADGDSSEGGGTALSGFTTYSGWNISTLNAGLKWDLTANRKGQVATFPMRYNKTNTFTIKATLTDGSAPDSSIVTYTPGNDWELAEVWFKVSFRANSDCRCLIELRRTGGSGNAYIQQPFAWIPIPSPELIPRGMRKLARFRGF